MPTILQLPDAAHVTPADRIPLSQSGVTHSASVGALLSGTQPAILTDTGTLLGRNSLGPGGPEPVAIGAGLVLQGATVSATGQDHARFSSQTALVISDQVVLSSKGEPKLLSLPLLRGLFAAGSNVSISADGTISATINATGARATIDTLPAGTAPAAQDLIGISQGGTDYAVTFASLIDGQTIDMAQPAGPAQDSDQFWVGQGTSTLSRQSLSALWGWIEGKLPGYKRPVVELSTDTALDTTVHNGRVLICSQPVTLQIVLQNLGSGFYCDIVNLSSGNVVLDGSIVTSSGSQSIPAVQTATLRCVEYSGGTTAFATISGFGGLVTRPEVVTGFVVTSCTADSVSLAWAPVPGAASYLIEYRTNGATDWNVLVTNAFNQAYSVTGLTPNIAYDFAILAVNAGGSSATPATVTATTAAPLAAPGAVVNLTAENVTANSILLSWSTPTSGGPAGSYLVQYRALGAPTWTESIPVISSTQSNVTSLVPNSAYEFQVMAQNSAGTGPASLVLRVTTAQATGNVSSVAWNLLPASSYQLGVGAVAVNVHVTPGTAAVQFGLSRSTSELPTSWIAANYVNTDLWGAYLGTPNTAGTWFVWVSGTDGSCPTVYSSGFAVS